MANQHKGKCFCGEVAIEVAGEPEGSQAVNPLNATATAGGTYVERGPYAITGAPYNLAPGSTAELFIGTFDDSPSAGTLAKPGFGVYMFVDNVAVIGTPLTTGALQRRPVPAVRERHH